MQDVFCPDYQGREVALVAREQAAAAPCCTACKSSDSPAVANCFSCSALLCANCVIAHQLMVAFEVSVQF